MATMKTTNNKQQAELRLGWGIRGLRKALARKDNIVIIDQLRFSSTVVTAIARGFVIEPNLDRSKRTPGYSNSPSFFSRRKPARIVMSSVNGGYLTMNALAAECVIFGSILNARAAANYVDALRHSATLIAAGERTANRDMHRIGHEKRQAEHNSIYSTEDLLGAGAVAHFSTMRKSEACKHAEEKFRRSKERLHDELVTTASHRFLVEKNMSHDTKFVSRLNRYDVVPRLYMVSGVAEIRKEGSP